jgi:hypothetical protein
MPSPIKKRKLTVQGAERDDANAVLCSNKEFDEEKD